MLKSFLKVVLVSFVIVPVAWGCAASPSEEDLRGSLELPLVAQSGAVTYRVSGTIELVGGPQGTVQVDLSGDQATQTVKLLPGTYTLHMVDGYACSVAPADPAFKGCSFLRAEPEPLVITAGHASTAVLDFSFHFDADVEVTLRNGSATLVLGPAVDRPCGAGCQTGELCVSTAGTEPKCSKRCSANTDCATGEGCFELEDGSDSACSSIVPALWTQTFGAEGSTSASTFARGIATDPDGNVYAVGATTGSLAGQVNQGKSDAFIEKRDASGKLLWRHQFGSSDDDFGMDVAVDGSGNAFMVGETLGSLPGLTPLGGGDAFVAKYDSAGNLLWMRLLGGKNADSASSVTLGGDGSVYVAGSVGSQPFDSGNRGKLSAIVQKLDAQGSSIWFKQWGGLDSASAVDVALDASGNSITVGYGGSHAFAHKLDPDGNPVWFKTLDGSAMIAYNVATSGGDIFVSGLVQESIPGQTPLGKADGFIEKLDEDGNQVWTRLVGTDQDDAVMSMTSTGEGNLIVGGYVGGALPDQSTLGGFDAFMQALDPDGNAIWTTQFGTTSVDSVQALAMSQDGKLLAGGGYGANAFVSKLVP